MKKVRFTNEGYEKLKKEHSTLIQERKLAVQDLKKAREMGDLSENGYYKASRAKLSSIDGRLRKLSSFLKQAIIIDNIRKDTVDVGSIVTLSDGKRTISYQVVGDLEADPSQGKISLLSPIGKAIYNKKIGNSIEINIPNGEITYKIINIS